MIAQPAPGLDCRQEHREDGLQGRRDHRDDLQRLPDPAVVAARHRRGPGVPPGARRRSRSVASTSPRVRWASPPAPSRKRSATAQERKAFGKPISQHQAIQIHLAEMATTLEAAKLMLYSAAEKKSSGERATSRPAMAKLFASEACHEIVHQGAAGPRWLRLLQGVHDRASVP